jgi:hypothetical protein
MAPASPGIGPVVKPLLTIKALDDIGFFGPAAAGCNNGAI